MRIYLAVGLFVGLVSLTAGVSSDYDGPGETQLARLNSNVLLFAAESKSKDTIGSLPTGTPRCEWVPTERIQPAAGQCGFHGRTPLPTPKPGVFECGVRLNAAKTGCESWCKFVRCQGP